LTKAFAGASQTTHLRETLRILSPYFRPCSNNVFKSLTVSDKKSKSCGFDAPYVNATGNTLTGVKFIMPQRIGHKVPVELLNKGIPSILRDICNMILEFLDRPESFPTMLVLRENTHTPSLIFVQCQ
jgi:hypothetical protein